MRTWIPAALLTLSPVVAMAQAPAAPVQRPYLTASVAQFRYESSLFHTEAIAIGGAIGTFLSPRVSVEFEASRPVRIPVSIERDGAGRGRIPYSAAGFVGFHPRPFGRVRLGLRAGVGHQRAEWSGPRPGERSALTLVVGMEAAVRLTSQLTLVPEVRAGGSINYSDGFFRPAAGVRWTF